MDHCRTMNHRRKNRVALIEKGDALRRNVCKSTRVGCAKQKKGTVAI
jgi:hypothetical protein